MYLKKKATVLISTVMILSLMSLLGCFMFKMMKNNNELSTLYKFSKDIYDLDKEEEEILNKFMKELNNRIDILNNQNKEELFSKSFEIKIDKNVLMYSKNENKIFLTTYKANEICRKREIIYIFKDGKIILVPTYTFEDKKNKNI